MLKWHDNFNTKERKCYTHFFKVALLGALMTSLSLADDFLARATNGALSDNSVGVKKLTADEASKVVGGYVTYYKVVDSY